MFVEIVHIADIHIPLHVDQFRDEMYCKVFEKFYEYLKTLQAPLVVLVGDFLHVKDNFKSRTIILAKEFIENIQKICPLVITLGNHDFSKNNKDIPDNITAIKNDKVIFLKESGVYEIGNYTFCFMSEFDDKIIEAPHENAIALYHNEWPKDDRFKNYKCVMLGHIHEHSSPALNAWYPGSLIQQNFGESIDNHGFIVWKDYKPTFIPIENEFIYLKWYKGDPLPQNKKIFLKCYLKKDEKPPIQDNILTTDIEYIDNLNQTIYQINNVSLEYDIELIKKHSTMPDEIIELHKELYMADDDLGFKPWNITYLEFQNVFIYGNNYINRINFENGVYNLSSPNATGKSSIVNIILFALFDQITNRNNILNDNAKNGYINIMFRHIDGIFTIKKTIKNHMMRGKMSTESDVNFYKGDVLLNGINKLETINIIKSYIGTLDMFKITNTITPYLDGFLLNMSYSDLKTFFEKMTKTEFYSKQLKKITDEIKKLQLKTSYNNGKIDQMKEIIQEPDKLEEEKHKLQVYIYDIELRNKQTMDQIILLKSQLSQVEDINESKEELEQIASQSIQDEIYLYSKLPNIKYNHIIPNNESIESLNFLNEVSKLNQLGTVEESILCECEVDERYLNQKYQSVESLEYMKSIELKDLKEKYDAKIISIDISVKLKDLLIKKNQDINSKSIIEQLSILKENHVKDIYDIKEKYSNKKQQKMDIFNKKISKLDNLKPIDNIGYIIDKNYVIPHNIEFIKQQWMDLDDYEGLIPNIECDFIPLKTSLEALPKAYKAFEKGEISYENARKNINNPDLMNIFIDQSEYKNIALYAKYLSRKQDIKHELMKYNGYIKNLEQLVILRDQYNEYIINKCSMKIDEINELYEKNIKKIQNKHDIEVNKINELFEENVKKIQNIYDFELSTIKNQYEADIDQINMKFQEKINYTSLCIQSDNNFKSNQKYLSEQHNIKCKNELIEQIHIKKSKLMYHQQTILDEINKIKSNNIKIINAQKKLKYLFQSEQNKIINSKLKDLVLIDIELEKKRLTEISYQLKLKKDYKKLVNDCSFDNRLIIYKEYARLFDSNMIPKMIREKRINEYSEEVSKILNKYTQYTFYIDYTNSKKPEFIIKTSLGKIRDGEKLSGFERIIFQIALNHACHPSSKLLLIDEKLDCMDQNNFTTVLIDSINIIKQYYDTIIFISHRDVPTRIINHNIKIECVDKCSKII